MESLIAPPRAILSPPRMITVIYKQMVQYVSYPIWYYVFYYALIPHSLPTTKALNSFEHGFAEHGVLWERNNRVRRGMTVFASM